MTSQQLTSNTNLAVMEIAIQKTLIDHLTFSTKNVKKNKIKDYLQGSGLQLVTKEVSRYMCRTGNHKEEVQGPFQNVKLVLGIASAAALCC